MIRKLENEFIEQNIKNKTISFMDYAKERYEKDTGKKFGEDFGKTDMSTIKRNLIKKLKTRFKVIFLYKEIDKTLLLDESNRETFSDIIYKKMDEVEEKMMKEYNKYKVSKSSAEKINAEETAKKLQKEYHELCDYLYSLSINRYLSLSINEKNFYDFILDKINDEHIHELKKNNWNVIPLEDRRYIIKQINLLTEEGFYPFSDDYLEDLNLRLLKPDWWPYYDQLDYLKSSYLILFDDINDIDFKRKKESALKKIIELNKILDELWELQIPEENEKDLDLKGLLERLEKLSRNTDP